MAPSDRTVHRRAFFLGLIGFVSLQLFEFRDLPLQFVYLETYHYNFRSIRFIPFSLPVTLDPLADRIVRIDLSYGSFHLEPHLAVGSAPSSSAAA